MALQRFKNSVINPINGQSKFDVGAGAMTCVFELSGAPNQLIDLQSLRLNCKIKFKNTNPAGTNDVNGNLSTNINNNNVFATGPYGGGGGHGYINIDERIGASSIIQSIRIEDHNNNILENIHNYPQLLASIMPMMANQDDFTTWCGPCYGIRSAGKRNTQLVVVNQKQHLSLKMYTGLFNSKPLPFSAVGQKLRITITFNNPQSVFYGGDLVAVAGAGTQNVIGPGNPINNANYELQNVKLNYKVVEMDGQAPMPSGGFVYRYFSNLQSTINASRYQAMYSPNTSNTISIINNFISSDSLNNYNRNSYLNQKLSNGRNVNDVEQFTQIKETQFKVNGVLSPYQFTIDERHINPNYDVLKALYYLSTITPYNMLKRCLISSATEEYGGSFDERLDVDRRPVAAGTGVRYDQLNMGSGQSFKGGNNYVGVIESGLEGNNPNEQLSTVYSFRKIVLQPSGSVIVN